MLCQALNYTVAAVASLREVMNSNSVSAFDTLHIKKFHKQNEPVLHFRNIAPLSALYVTSLFTGTLSFLRLLWWNVLTRQAAQEILFRLVIEQETQREGKRKWKRERSFSDRGHLSEEPYHQIKKPVSLAKGKKAQDEVKIALTFVITRV